MKLVMEALRGAVAVVLVILFASAVSECAIAATTPEGALGLRGLKAGAHAIGACLLSLGANTFVLAIRDLMRDP